jgi:hypothetical protein
MSTLVNIMLSVALRRKDDRELEYQIGDPVVSEGLNYWPPWTDPMLGQNFQILDGAGGVGGVLALATCWDDRIRYGGWSNLPYRITGIVQDAGGNPITNAVCSLFRTSDDAWMYDTVSAAGGQYDFGVSDTTTTYYIVAFDFGNNRQGVTVNTLTGA